MTVVVYLIHKGFLKNGFDFFDFRFRQSAEILNYSLLVNGSDLIENDPPMFLIVFNLNRVG
jgi:hypothetical protein